MVVMPRSATAEGPGAEQGGGDVGDDLVDEAGGEEGGGQRGAALEQTWRMPRAPGAWRATSAGSRVAQRAGSRPRRRAARAERGSGAVPDDDAERLAGGAAAVPAVADGEARVVGERGAGADDDGAAAGPQRVDVGTGRLAR